MRNITAYGRFTHADIDDIGVRFRYANCANRTGFEKAIGNSFPVDAAIRRFPDAATRRPEVIDLGQRRHTGYCRRTPTAIRTDLPPFQAFQHTGIIARSLLRLSFREIEKQRKNYQHYGKALPPKRAHSHYATLLDDFDKCENFIDLRRAKCKAGYRLLNSS